MKKIMFVANRLGGGGAERVLTLLANEFHRNGYEVTVVSFHHYDNPYRVDPLVIELMEESKIQQILKLRKTIKRVKPDAIIAFEYHVSMKTVIASTGFNCKVIVSERNDPGGLHSRRALKWLRDYLYGCADVLVCQTNDAKVFFSERIQKKTVIILNPVKENLPRWNTLNHNKTIINFCRLDKQKNIPLLLEAFRKVHEIHPDYFLAIYGSGSEEQRIQDLILAMDLEKSVYLEPFADNIHEIACQCAMYVSSSDYEGLSNSMLEAMAMGMPVICTDCPIGGARMVIKNGVNGILTPVGDPTELSRAINDVIEYQMQAEAMGKEAGHIREALSLPSVYSRWKELV